MREGRSVGVQRSMISFPLPALLIVEERLREQQAEGVKGCLEGDAARRTGPQGILIAAETGRVPHLSD